jgi:hypothetical protein
MGHFIAADRQRVIGFRKEVTPRMLEYPAIFLEGIDLECMHNNAPIEETRRLRSGQCYLSRGANDAFDQFFALLM